MWTSHGDLNAHVFVELVQIPDNEKMAGLDTVLDINTQACIVGCA